MLTMYYRCIHLHFRPSFVISCDMGAMQSRERAKKGARQLLLSLWLDVCVCVIVVCSRYILGTYVVVNRLNSVTEPVRGINFRA